MADEIETTAQLIDLAHLRDVVIYELTATRLTAPDQYGVDLPSEELHAPDSPDDDIAMSLRACLEKRCLGVRRRIQTCNAYGDFVVDAEAIFDLPAPVSPLGAKHAQRPGRRRPPTNQRRHRRPS